MRDDQIGEIGHGVGCCGAQSGAEIVPERDTELLTGLHQSVESISAISAIVAACCAADFSAGDLATDVSFGPVVMQRNIGMVENAQKLGLVGV